MLGCQPLDEPASDEQRIIKLRNLVEVHRRYDGLAAMTLYKTVGDQLNDGFAHWCTRNLHPLSKVSLVKDKPRSQFQLENSIPQPARDLLALSFIYTLLH